MAITCSTHRRPTSAGPCTPADTLDALRIATRDGSDRAVSIACLDGARRPMGLFIVDECDGAPEQVSFVVDFLLDAVQASETMLDAIVLASSRPGAGVVGPTNAEVALWPDLVGRCAAAGATLLAWYLLADGSVRTIGSLG